MLAWRWPASRCYLQQRGRPPAPDSARVLAVARRHADGTALAILCLADAIAFGNGDGAVGFGARLHARDAHLATIKPVGFLRRQLARGKRLVDALLLTSLAR